jgi:hypothetical protein
MEIARWNPSVDGTALKRVAGRRGRSSGFLGLIGTVLLHALVLQSVILGTRTPKVRPPDSQGPGATLIKSSTEPADELVLLELPTVDMNAQALREELASAGDLPKNLLVVVVSPDKLPHVDIPADNLDEKADTAASIDSGDPAGRALLFGRYSGQIQARIERAWQRPRSPVNVEGSQPSGPSVAQPDFRCQVRILQDNHGAVQEVQMLACNGSVTWQQSLVTAILSASPLPAPPDPAVFTHSLTMTFEGQAYRPGSSTDGYDVDRTVAASLAGSFR